jgi:hypothetical protein
MKRHFNFWTIILFCLPFSGLAVVDFEKDVWPILEDRCVECHRAPHEQAGRIKNPKAGLRLDGAAYIMHGGDDGPVITVDHPSQSSLYTRVTLPFSDDDHMPPKGEPLTQEQKETLRKWIAQGVDFGAWVGATDGLDTLAQRGEEKGQYIPPHITFYQGLAKGVKVLPDTFIAGIEKETGLLIRPIGIGSPLLEARIVSSGVECNTETLRKLIPLGDHLVKLDLRRATLSEEGCLLLASFGKVTHLNLRDSTVKDEGVKALAGMSNLISLNLSGTQLSDYGIRPLLGFENLTSLYLWGSRISPDRLQFLKNRLDGVTITP